MLNAVSVCYSIELSCMKKLVIVLFLMILGCKPKEVVEKPDHLIQRDTMISILYDLSLLQSASNHNIDSNYNKNIPAFIAKKYKVDSLQFVQSNRYYASQVDEYQKMYEEVYQKIKTEILKTESGQ